MTMEKHYLFLSSAPFDKIEFEDQLSQIGVDTDHVVYFGDRNGEFLADSKIYAKLDSLSLVIRDDLGASISFLAAHQNTVLEQDLLQKSASYFPCRAMFPSDVILKEISFGDYSAYPLLKACFDSVPHDLLLTAGTYLRCGCDESLSAQTLFVHRNTFLYRLNKFIELTNLDIRDYHNALLLELYFQISVSYRN